MRRRLADAYSFGNRRLLLRSRDAKDRLRDCYQSLKQEPSLSSTETTNSASEELFVPREIELQGPASRFGKEDLSRRRTSSSSCVSSSRWDYVSARCLSLRSFVSQTWAMLRTAYQGQKYHDLPWWKTEFARAVSFCVLFPFIITRPFLFFPILLFSGFLQSDETSYRWNVKQQRALVS